MSHNPAVSGIKILWSSSKIFLFVIKIFKIKFKLYISRILAFQIFCTLKWQLLIKEYCKIISNKFYDNSIKKSFVIHCIIYTIGTITSHILKKKYSLFSRFQYPCLLFYLKGNIHFYAQTGESFIILHLLKIFWINCDTFTGYKGGYTDTHVICMTYVVWCSIMLKRTCIKVREM